MLWQKIIDWAKYFLNHKEQFEKQTANIKEQETTLKNMMVALERVAVEQDRLRENEVHEREKLALRMENALLRERHLLPAPPRSDASNDENLRLIEELKREIEELRRQIKAHEQKKPKAPTELFRRRFFTSEQWKAGAK